LKNKARYYIIKTK